MYPSASTKRALIQQTGRLQTLTEISRVVTGTLDLRTLYDTIYEQIGRVMDTSQFFIALNRPDRGVIEVPYLQEEGNLFVDEEFPFGDNTTSLIIAGGEPLLYQTPEDYLRFEQSQGLNSYIVGDKDSASGIFVPLNTGSRTLGALSVQSTRPYAYSQDDVQTLSIIASQAAVAIENARLFCDQRDRVFELQSIQSIVQELTPLHDIPSIAHVIDQELKRLIDYHACRLFFLDLDEESLVPTSSAPSALQIRIGEGIAGWVALHGQSVIIPNTLEDHRVKHIADTPVREESMIGAPLVYEGRVQGVITLSKLGAHQFDENSLRLLEIVAGQAAIAFDRARLYRELRTDALTDPLTRLYNRRYLVERFHEEKSRALRNQHSLTAMMIDIDRFKQVNDRFGHEAGDAVLRELAGLVRSAVRAEDIVARFGGEEFCVLVPEVSPEMAEHMAERLRSAIEDHGWPDATGERAITVSVGLSFLEPDDDEHELFARADRAMYEVKNNGGNGVGLWREGSFQFSGFTPSSLRHRLQTVSQDGQEQEASLSNARVIDLTDRVGSEAPQTSALYDSLTGLPSRTLLRDRIEHEILGTRGDGNSFALLFLDVVRFKDVNDTFGYEYGDILLRHVTQRLQMSVRQSDTIARLHGDEFAVLLRRVDVAGAERAAEKMAVALAQPFDIDGHIVDIDVSIGIALYPEHGSDSATLMRRTDRIMHAARQSGNVYMVYPRGEDEDAVPRLRLAGELRNAIESNQLVLHYQPQINLRTGCAEHVEALVRWEHPERGFLPPGTFIPVAEETGLVKPLTTWVLNEAMRQCAIWKSEGLDMSVAVNLSARSLHDPDLVDAVAQILETWGVTASSLEVEITESAIILDPDRAMKILARLRLMGVRIAVDDFGTGYASLAYLKRLPVDQIKIDRSFVTDMTTNSDSMFIVRSIIDLGRNLGLQVLAEGVENQATLNQLALVGCDMTQGFYLSRPIPVEAVTRWLHARSQTQLQDWQELLPTGTTAP